MHGHLVVVTGGSSGIGRAVLAHAGTVPDVAERVTVSRRAGPDGTTHVELDLADPAAWSRLASEFSELVEKADPDRTLLLHAAGVVSPIGFAGEVDDEAVARSALVNFASMPVVGHAWLRAVHGRPGRHQVCLLGSGAATSVYPGWSLYGAAKAALDQWVRIVGAEQEQRGGVEVCAVAPGTVDTPMQDALRAADPASFPRVGKFRDLHDEGKLRSPAEVAAQLWDVLDDGLEHGAVVDLRTL